MKPPEFVEKLLREHEEAWFDDGPETVEVFALAFLKAVLRKCKLRVDEESVKHTHELIQAMSADKLLAWAEASDDE